MMAVNEAGGRVFVAVMHPTFYDRVGDVLKDEETVTLTKSVTAG